MNVAEVTSVKVLAAILSELLNCLVLKVVSEKCEHRYCNAGRWPDGGDCHKCNGLGEVITLEQKGID